MAENMTSKAIEEIEGRSGSIGAISQPAYVSL
jgi:hypothetical protein